MVCVCVCGVRVCVRVYVGPYVCAWCLCVYHPAAGLHLACTHVMGALNLKSKAQYIN